MERPGLRRGRSAQNVGDVAGSDGRGDNKLAARIASYAIVQKRVDGLAIGAESSSARFATVMAERAVCEFVVEYVPEALAGASPYLQMHHQRGIVAGIAAGAAEIQLNIIASDVLELPREPR